MHRKRNKSNQMDNIFTSINLLDKCVFVGLWMYVWDNALLSAKKQKQITQMSPKWHKHAVMLMLHLGIGRGGVCPV